MIALVRGIARITNDLYVVIETSSGLGYEIYCTKDVTSNIIVDESVLLLTHQITKEDGTTTYGFNSFESLFWFKSLIKVSGIGAKTAIAILNSIDTDAISMAIQSRNEDLFGSVSGIGKKTATRLISELEKEPFKIQMLIDNLKISDLISSYFLSYQKQDSSNIIKQINDAQNNDMQNNQTKISKTIKDEKNKIQKKTINNIIKDATLALEALGYSKINSFSKVSLIVKNNPDISIDEIIKTALKADKI